MKLLFMGSLPTFQRTETREISEQERPFVRACEDLGFAAASRGHSVLVSDDHPSSADWYVVRGAARFAEEHATSEVKLEVNRPEGAEIVYDDLPANVNVQRSFHAELDRGTLIPNLAALDASDVLITIGGKLTVRLMGNLAAHRAEGVLAVPAFGGASAELFEHLRYLYKSVLRPDQLSILQSVWLQDSGKQIVALAEALATRDGGAPSHSYFLSYTWNESELADHLEVLLRRNSRIVNRDESIFQAGVDLSDVVKSLIQESDTFIGLWGQQFKESTWCPQELEYALDRMSKQQKPTRVVLLTTDDTEVPIRFTGKLRLPGADREKRELSIRRLIEEEKDV